jgi:putative ABC transport system permease protein
MVSELLRRFLYLFQRRRFDRELQEEMRFHLDSMGNRRRFGNPTLLREVSRDMWGWTALETWLSDIRYALRMMRRSPGFSAIAIAALALGIGANAAIFSVVNAVLLRPLPYRQPESLVRVFENNRQRNEPRYSVAPANFVDWRDQNQVFEGIAAIDPFSSLNLTGRGEPLRIQGVRVSASLFPLLGIHAVVGRTFRPEEDQPGRNRVVLLAHGLWQRQFGADPKIVGQTLTLNDVAYTVIGVLPAGFQYPAKEFELFVPLALDAREAAQRGTHPLQVVARLKAGVTLGQAQTEMDAIATRLEQQYADMNFGKRVTVVPLQEQIVGEVRTALRVLLGAVVLVLLIACSNVANLLLARALARQKELAVRAALGAGRFRLVRQLLMESLLLAGFGCAAGLVLARLGIDVLVNAALPRAHEVNMDGHVLGFTIAVSVLTGLIFGLAPALASWNVDLNHALKQGGRAHSGGAREGSFRSALVVSQVLLATMLLTGAGLLVRSFWRLQHVNPGFNPEKVLTAQVSLPGSRYKERHQIDQFYEQLVAHLHTLPGVQSAAGAAYLPLSGTANAWAFQIEGRPPLPPGQSVMAGWRPVTAGYFRTMQIPVASGREFTPQDVGNAPLVVIINESMARVFWPGEDPVGKRLRLVERWHSIVGVVRDVKHFGLSGAASPEMYFPYQQLRYPWLSMTVVARTQSDAMLLASAFREAVREIDRDLPVYNLRTLEQTVSASVARPRLHLALLGTFAAIALSLAALGIYGVVSYSVRQRQQEIGIRVALGAGHGDVMTLILKQILWLTLTGVAIGLAGAAALGQAMTTLLFGITATDGTTFVGVAAVLAAVAFGASYIPARRAAKLDPTVALRNE